MTRKRQPAQLPRANGRPPVSIVPTDAACDSRLSNAAVRMYVLLCAYRRTRSGDHETGWAYPSEARLAKDMCVSVREVRRRLKELAARRWIHVVPRLTLHPDFSGHPKARAYEVLAARDISASEEEARASSRGGPRPFEEEARVNLKRRPASAEQRIEQRAGTGEVNNASNRMEMPAIETAPMAASPPLPVDSTKPEEPEQVLASCPFDPHIRSLAIRFSELAGVPLPLQREPVHRWENGLLQVVKNRHVLPGLDDVVEAFKQTDRTLLEPLDLRAAALAADILNERPLPPESEAVEAGECNPTRETDEARTEPEAMWVYSELRGVHAAFLSASGLTQLPTGPVERDHWNTALRELAAVVTPDNLVDLMSRARISGVQVGSPSDLLDLARDGRQP